MHSESELLFGPGEIFERAFWKLAPESVRLRLASLKAKEHLAVPETKSTVYCYSSAVEEEFSRFETVLVNSRTQRPPKCSLIATVKNEAKGAKQFFNAIISQTVHPDELVICDGGSTDGTPNILKDLKDEWESSNSCQLPFELVIIEEPGAGISEGRNKAIAACRNEILALTDFGCELDSHWLERITLPFELNRKIDISMGWYEPRTKTEIAEAFSQFLIPPLERIEPSTFLPSARSVALRKSLWKSAGGFPEYLSYAGEDSLFDYFCKYQAREAAFVPEALVYWDMPETYAALVKTIYRYSLGDAEGGKLFWRHYLWAARHFLKFSFELLIAFICFSIGGTFFGLLGFLSIVFALLRVTNCSLRYQPFSRGDDQPKQKLFKYIAASSMFFAQATGFLVGLGNRRRVEDSRIENAKSEKHLIVEVTTGGKSAIENAKTFVGGKLADNYFVSILEPLDWQLPLDHPNLEHFKTEHFSEEMLKEKYQTGFEKIKL